MAGFEIKEVIYEILLKDLLFSSFKVRSKAQTKELNIQDGTPSREMLSLLQEQGRSRTFGTIDSYGRFVGIVIQQQGTSNIPLLLHF